MRRPRRAQPRSSFFFLVIFWFCFRRGRKFGSVERKAQTGPSIFAKSPPALSLFMEGPASAFLPIIHTFLTGSWMNLKTFRRWRAPWSSIRRPRLGATALVILKTSLGGRCPCCTPGPPASPRRLLLAVVPHPSDVVVAFPESKRNMPLVRTPGLPGVSEPISKSLDTLSSLRTSGEGAERSGGHLTSNDARVSNPNKRWVWQQESAVFPLVRTAWLATHSEHRF